MTLETGNRLGGYEILGSLGVGGMGEVYRARDTNLGREVAIKVLPESVAQDAERLARFEREARALAALNHPNVATLFGMERHEGTPFLVMEVVEGPTLAERIAEGPMAPDEAAAVFLQIAEGLEAAHEKGIIHRDLKPANVKLADADSGAGGRVKILDFGLAKAFDAGDPTASPTESPTMTASPTLTLAATVQGVILGTAAYMAPEQARGKAVDKRADIWAFGVCLWEALTGERLFAGEDASVTLAAVLRDEPDADRLGAGVPAHVRALLRRCLQKDPRQRLRDIGDARLALAEPDSGVAEQPASATSPRPLWWAAAALALGLGGGWLLSDRFAGPEVVERPQVTRTLIARPTSHDNYGVAFSPDGRAVAYMIAPGDETQIQIHPIDEVDGRPLGGTDETPTIFFFSARQPVDRLLLAHGRRDSQGVHGWRSDGHDQSFG